MKHIKNRAAALLLVLAMVLSMIPMAFAAEEFPDMPAEDDPSYAAVKSAVDNGIMTGDNGMLKLEDNILRSTVSKMLAVAFAAKGEADVSGYSDVEAGKWYAEWMAKANQMGVMTGDGDKMDPSRNVTLQEVATMLARALGLPLGTAADLVNVPGGGSVSSWAVPYVAALVKAGYISDVSDAGLPMNRRAFAEVLYNVSGKGNYVSEGEITQDVDGNIVITSDGVSLKDITVTGDIIIADGVDAGSIVLDGVKVEGRVVVRGAGAEMKNGTTAAATVVAAASGETTVKADASSNAGAVTVAGTNGKAADKVTVDAPNSDVAVADTANEVEIGNAKQVVTADGVKTTVTGTVEDLVVPDGAKPEITNNGTIKNVTSNEDVTIAGTGTVENKTGAGTVTDGSGNTVAGSDEPVDMSVIVPDLSTAPEVPAVKVPEKAPSEAPKVEADEDGEEKVKDEGDASKHGEGDDATECTLEVDKKASVEPTCTQPGKLVKKCEICGKTTEQVLGKLGHEASETPIVVEGNCRGAGYATLPCVRADKCGVKNVKVIKGQTLEELAADGAVASEIEGIDQTAHVSAKNEEGEAAPVYVSKGNGKHIEKCADCNAEFGELKDCAPAEGTEEEPVVYVKTGAQHGTKCKDCNAMFYEAHDEESAAYAGTEPTCTEAGSKSKDGGSYVCGTCGYEKLVTIAALGHKWSEWEAGTEANRGLQVRKCTREGCGGEDGPAVETRKPEHVHSWSDGACQGDAYRPVCTAKHNHVKTDFKNGVCSVCGAECSVDHSKIYTTKECSTCGAAGTLKCEKDHENWPTATDDDSTCPDCGVKVTHVHNYATGSAAGTEEAAGTHGTCSCRQACPAVLNDDGKTCKSEGCKWTPKVEGSTD